MNNDLKNKILLAQIKAKHRINITVTGVSMNPVLFEDDIITVEAVENYTIGDVLVFTYKYNDLLVHRLLKIENDTYFCKGDNALRLEDIKKDQIIGKVVLKNGEPLPECDDEFIKMSLDINRELRKCKYDSALTRQSEIYKLYEKKYLIKK